jgi:S-DNA-T family DNA segregation ATPase FtsK/SpoIIIE
MDGDSLFKTQFARMNRAEFPEGRGMFVRNGKAIRVQVALL